ncbi:DUF2269 family protein [Parasedimentitalea huanghaiensis]|uniref:DUF2269 family protein n=1 Tax=Parasedimentitalea huanghaiensis TaxID=2682100 RepID=A0A6L6WK77_9RHOB|nr:DUF2269 family protein [Zongyanglinia huanghaiensis]MVO18216.1 DUF2269 family protein [Zongyanglinia huanghaiensis]
MFDPYLVAKLVHIFAISIMIGATLINGLIHGQAKTASPVEAAGLLRCVLRVNRLLMGPSLAVIVLTGFWMVHTLGYDLQTGWIATSVGMSLALILAFVVGARVEHRLLYIATAAAAKADMRLPKYYQRVFLQAVPIGLLALILSLLSLALMIFKPF